MGRFRVVMAIEIVDVSMLDDTSVSEVVEIRLWHSLVGRHEAGRLVHIVPDVHPAVGPDEVSLVFMVLATVYLLEEFGHIRIHVVKPMRASWPAVANVRVA